MTDERNIQHDKKVASDKKNHGQAVVENSSVVPQPGMKPALIDADTGPSNKVAHEMYKHGEQPRAHTGAEVKPDEDKLDEKQRDEEEIAKS